MTAISTLAVGSFGVFLVIGDTWESKFGANSVVEEENVAEISKTSMSDEEKQKIFDEIDRTVMDIAIGLDGNRTVSYDQDGIPVVKCTVMENEAWSIDRNCKVTLKN